MIKKVLSHGTLILLAFVVIPQAAFAEEKTKQNNWEFNLTPLYLWGISIEGDATLGSRETSNKIDFSEIFDNLEGVFSLNFSGRYKQTIGFMFDYMYLDIGANGPTDLDDNSEVNLKSQLAQLVGTYNFGSQRHTFDVAVGVRFFEVEVETDFDILPISLSEKKDFLDPIIGARYLWRMADKWHLKLYGDIGGFGVSSDFTWQALGLIDFWPWQHVGFTGGYRSLGYQFEDSSRAKPFELDLLAHGPLVGISFRW